jgi:hypothetical protein
MVSTCQRLLQYKTTWEIKRDKGEMKMISYFANNPGGTDELHGDEGNCFP